MRYFVSRNGIVEYKKYVSSLQKPFSFVLSSSDPTKRFQKSHFPVRIVESDNAVDLNATNFDSVFKDTLAKYAVLEFFSSWCHACRNYKPHYEKVARLFNGPEAIHPGTVLMTRVDCAVKMNVKLCDKFSIKRYPMLFWAPPRKFVGGSWEPKQEKLGSSYGLDDQKVGNEHLLPNVSDHEQISQAGFLQLFIPHHPSRRYRNGSVMNFDDHYAVMVSCRCNYTESRLFFKQHTKWRPRVRGT
ncbi:Sulfhydryl oxidase 1 [Raphanus sativus]|nr:Sulfhydryl oxidase 1 [Raphanus sativus]